MNKTFEEIKRLNKTASFLLKKGQVLSLKYQKEKGIDYVELEQQYTEYFNKKGADKC